jgi:hypothetical protein
MITSKRVIHVDVANRADFLREAGIREAVGADATPPWLLLEVTTAPAGARPELYLVRFVATGGVTVAQALAGWGDGPTIGVVAEDDPRHLAVGWMLHHRYTNPAMGRVLALMERDKLAFYGRDGNAAPLEKVASNLGGIPYICLCNSNDGKMSVFAVTDVDALRKGLRERSGGNKVTFAFLKGDSPEVSNSEVSAQDSTWRKFFQSLTGSFLTAGISALVTLLGIIITTLAAGSSPSASTVLVPVITFLIFTILGLLTHTRA